MVELCGYKDGYGWVNEKPAANPAVGKQLG
jgi:hypothetical protein